MSIKHLSHSVPGMIDMRQSLECIKPSAQHVLGVQEILIPHLLPSLLLYVSRHLTSFEMSWPENDKTT